jgi:uncharacterized protein YoxC
LPTKDQKPVYEIHDYSAVESYMRAQSERRELANQAISKSASAHRLKYVALVIASSGFAALLVLFGISLLDRESMINDVTKMTAVENANFNDTSILHKLKKIEANMGKLRSELNEQNSQIDPSTQQKLKDIEASLEKLNFTSKVKSPDLKNKNQKTEDKIDFSTMFHVFKSVPSSIYGFDSVVTSYVFPNSQQTTYPQNQYCYVILKSEGLTSQRVELGFKKGKGSIDKYKYTLVESYEISPSQFKSAQRDCRFLE